MSEVNMTVPDHGVTNALIEEISPFVGRLIIDFTFIEQSLSAILAITADEVLKADLKVKRCDGLKDKVEQCKKIFRCVPALANHCDAMRKHLEQLGQIKDIRDAFTHGTMGHFDHKTSVLTLNKVYTADGHHIIQPVNISLEVLKKSVNVSIELAAYFGQLAKILFETMHADD